MAQRSSRSPLRSTTMSGNRNVRGPASSPNPAITAHFRESRRRRNATIKLPTIIAWAREHNHDSGYLDQLVTLLAALGPGKERSLVHVQGHLNSHQALRSNYNPAIGFRVVR